MNWKHGDKIIKVLAGAGFKTASFQRVDSCDGRVIKLIGGDIEYAVPDMNEIKPVIPGFRSFLVAFDGGQEERVRYDDDAEFPPIR